MRARTCGSLLQAILLAASGPAFAQGADEAIQRTRLAEACGIELKLSEAGCRCLADRAVADLNNLQRDYLLATAVAPRAAERMRASISQQDIHVLATFLAAAEQECSAQ
ncbi:MAG: hypothetical protein M3453_09880 [Pseudomonadota bacterium]|nr:hypothetical protein [Pseudomonadota bacterium]